MTILLLEVRRSPARFAVVPLLALGWIFIYVRDDSWLGIWPAASITAQGVALPFGVVFAFVGSWSAGRIHRQAAMDHVLYVARSEPQRRLVQIASTVVYASILYLIVVAAVVVSMMDVMRGPGFLWPGYVLLGWLTIVSAACAGHLLGYICSARLTTSVAAGLLAFILLSSGGQEFAWVPYQYTPSMTVSAVALLARVAICATILAAACFAPKIPPVDLRSASGRRRLALGLSWPVGGAIALAATFALGGAVQVAREVPSDPDCTRGPSRICIWPDNRKFLPDLQRASDRLTELPPGKFKLRAMYSEKGLRGPKMESGSEGFDTTISGTWGAYTDISFMIVSDTYNANCPPENAPPETYERLSRAEFSLTSFLQLVMNDAPQPPDIHGGPGGVNLEKVYALTRKPAGAQSHWIDGKARIEKLATCR